MQTRVLRVLANVRPRWTLAGGGALVGLYTRHRETRDLDLFWRAVFSPLTLAWVLRELPVARIAAASGWAEKDAVSLEAFRDELVQRITSLASPDG